MTHRSHLDALAARALLAAQRAGLGVVRHALFRRSASEQPKRILLLRIAALGDFLFSVPAMRELRAAYPDAHITLLTSPTTKSDQRQRVSTYMGSSTELPWLDLVIPSVLDEAIEFSPVHPCDLIADLRARLHDMHPDAAVILAHSGEPGASLLRKLVFLRAVGVTAPVYGWRTRSSMAWLRAAQFEHGKLEHKVLGPLRSVEHLTGTKVERESIRFEVDIGHDGLEWAAQLWSTEALHGRRVIAVAPGSIQPHKRWPIERFIEICRRLHPDAIDAVMVLGTKGDAELGERLRSELNAKVVNLAGRTSIQQSAGVLGRCVLLIANDGGAAHLAAAVKCPVVSIVPGIEYPDSIEPWGFGHLAVRHPVPCAPCYSFTHCPLKYNACMLDLPVDSVERACRIVLVGATRAGVAAPTPARM